MLETIQLSSLNLPLDTLVLLSFYLLLGIYTTFSAILYYHWKSYASDAKVTTYTLTLYFVTTIPLLIILVILALTIT